MPSKKKKKKKISAKRRVELSVFHRLIAPMTRPSGTPIGIKEAS